MTPAPRVIGVGNPWRSDDGAGIAVARALGGTTVEGDGTLLLGAWDGAREVAVVDAVASDAPPGTIHRFDAHAGPLPARMLRSSGHHFGVADAIELGRALGQLPPVLHVYGIEGEDFGTGQGLSAAVTRAVDAVVAEMHTDRVR